MEERARKNNIKKVETALQLFKGSLSARNIDRSIAGLLYESHMAFTVLMLEAVRKDAMETGYEIGKDAILDELTKKRVKDFPNIQYGCVAEG